LSINRKLELIESLIQQAISNLLLNAIEALESHDIPDKKITIHTNLVREEYLIEVSDNGPGIDPKISAKIFDLFESTKSSGSGIGLWISQHIAQRHKGRLTFNSTDSGGTTFTLTLPSN